MVNEQSEKDYVPFIVNRGLGYFQDTVLLANEMNVNCSNLDHKMQYDFLKGTVKKKKRFSKWSKNNRLEEIELIKEYYGYSDEKAKDVVNILGDDHIKYIKSKLDKGGAK